MKINFDREAITRTGGNTKYMEKFLEDMGRFCNAEVVEYIDKGKGETYRITKKNGQTLELNVSGNMYDGGFMSGKIKNSVDE